MRINTRLSPHVQLQYRVPERRSLGTRLTRDGDTREAALFPWGLQVLFVASFPGLPHFYLPFAFTILHGSGRPAKNKMGKKRFENRRFIFCQSSTPVYYCECKRKIKRGEAWERGYCMQILVYIHGRDVVIESWQGCSNWILAWFYWLQLLEPELAINQGRLQVMIIITEKWQNYKLHLYIVLNWF